MQSPLLSTLIRSHVPAPINTVQFSEAEPGKHPITVLLFPLLIDVAAPTPIAILP